MVDKLNITELADVKAINFEHWGGFQGFLDATSNGAGTNKDATILKRALPWLAKANSMTANAIADLPFDILKESGEVFDTSDEWKNKLGGMPEPQNLFRMLASSLCGGEAYIIPQTTGKLIVDLHYCAPNTIEPRIDNRGNLLYFQRASNEGLTGIYSPIDGERLKNANGEVMYFWLPDADVEIGPALTHPMGTALLSCQLLTGIDSTLKIYADRGFVPATLLAVQGMTQKSEAQRTENWWNRFLRGWANTLSKVINAQAMDVKRVGAGLDELQSVYKDITRQAIENIGAAHGIPAALFMSDAAYATEMNAMIKHWYSTSEFVAIYHCIEDTFNNQLLSQWGLKLIFKPESIDAFQEDENQRAQSLKLYTDCGFTLLQAIDMLGIEISDKMRSELEQQETEKKKREEEMFKLEQQNAAQPPVQVQGKPIPPKPQKPPAKTAALDAEQIKYLGIWRDMALRNFKKGKGVALDFENEAITPEIADPIRERLKAATTEADVLAAFEIQPTVTPEMMFMELKRANDLLEAEVVGA